MTRSKERLLSDVDCQSRGKSFTFRVAMESFESSHVV
jgi:hypothetical protein